MDAIKGLMPASLMPARGTTTFPHGRCGNVVVPLAGIRHTSYSACIADAVNGPQRRGVVHSAFAAAANILFPGDFIVSLNARTSARMPNGIRLATPAGTFPFSHLHPAMPVLLGAGQLIIDAIDYALDLSYCPQWDPYIERPLALNMGIVQKNGVWLAQYTFPDQMRMGIQIPVPTCTCQVQTMARYLCGRGIGLTPSGDDMLAGWMALQWLLYGPEPCVIEACRQILEIAAEQTHLLSQCWLGYAARGAVAMPVRDLLTAMTREDDGELETATQSVLAMGATSGHDLIQGMLLGLQMYSCQLP